MWGLHQLSPYSLLISKTVAHFWWAEHTMVFQALRNIETGRGGILLTFFLNLFMKIWRVSVVFGNYCYQNGLILVKRVTPFKLLIKDCNNNIAFMEDRYIILTLYFICDDRDLLSLEWGFFRCEYWDLSQIVLKMIRANRNS